MLAHREGHFYLYHLSLEKTMYDVFAVQKDIRLGELSLAQIAQKYDMTLGEVEDVLDEMCAQEASYEDSY